MTRTFNLDVTYRLASGPPATPFADYAAPALAAFKKLLDDEPPEAALQRFLERNPCFVPGALGPGSSSGHGPLHSALITQPRLPGLRSRQPDFMWLACHSTGWFPMLIEIERSSKRVFTAKRTPSAELSQARHQLAQWRAWFGQPENVTKFIADYGIPTDWVRSREMEMHSILVYGRRSEFEYDVELSRERAAMFNGSREQIVSFDRLAPDPNMAEAVTVKAIGSGKFTAVAILPTLQLTPFDADRWRAIDGVEAAIDADDRIPKDRGEFLKARLPYWREWAHGERGMIESWARE